MIFTKAKIDKETLAKKIRLIFSNYKSQTHKIMKKTKQIAMALLIFIIATIAVVGLFGLPHEDCTFGVYVALLFASKAVGVLALMAMILVVRWNDKHRWLEI